MNQANYGFFEIIRNIFWVFKTKLLFPKARLIRFPIIIRGRKYINFGKKLTTGSRCRIDVHGKHETKKIIFGENVNMGYDVRISCCQKITIGNNVLIGSKVLITDNSHGNYTGNHQDSPESSPNKRELVSSTVKIEDNVWIGENVVIQKGVTVGKGSIIGANSVVTRNIPKNVIAVGCPAKIIKKYNEDEHKWVKE